MSLSTFAWADPISSLFAAYVNRARHIWELQIFIAWQQIVTATITSLFQRMAHNLVTLSLALTRLLIVEECFA